MPASNVPNGTESDPEGLDLRTDVAELRSGAQLGPISVPVPDLAGTGFTHTGSVSDPAVDSGDDRSAKASGVPRNGPEARGGRGRGVGPGRTGGSDRRYAFRRS